jgi:hypothetical protein
LSKYSRAIFLFYDFVYRSAKYDSLIESPMPIENVNLGFVFLAKLSKEEASTISAFEIISYI